MTDAFLEAVLGVQFYRHIFCNTTVWVARKQHKFTSHSLDLKPKIRALADSASGENLIPGLHTLLLTVSSW